MKTKTIFATTVVLTMTLLLICSCGSGNGEKYNEEEEEYEYVEPPCDLTEGCEYIVGQAGASSVEQCIDIYTLEGFIRDRNCAYVSVLSQCFCSCIEVQGIDLAVGCDTDCLSDNCNL